MISPGSGPPEEESSELSDVSSEELSGRPLEESTSLSEEDEDEEYFEDEGSDSAGETEAGEENRGAVNEEESESKIVQPRSDAADSADDLAETDEEQKN